MCSIQYHDIKGKKVRSHQERERERERERGGKVRRTLRGRTVANCSCHILYTAFSYLRLR